MARSNRNQPPPTVAAAMFDVPPAIPEAVDDSRDESTAVECIVRESAGKDLPAAAISPETPPLQPQPARQGDEGRPYCPVHQCLMRANGTREQVTTYTCPVPSCTCSEKRARPTVQINREPMACPNRTCANPQQYLEFDPKRSTVAHLHMECPACKFSLKQPRPQFNPLETHKRRRPPREDLADR